MIHRSKEIDIGEWINVSHKTKTRISKEEKARIIKEKEAKKEAKKEKFVYEEENYETAKNYRKKDFYGKFHLKIHVFSDFF